MASLDAKVSEGAQLIKKKEYHAAIAILQSVCNSGVAAASTSQRAKSYAEKALAHLSNDPYMALNIPRASNRGDVKKNYRKLALKYHPDKNEHTADLFKVIQVAYDTLKDKPTPKKGNAFSHTRTLHDRSVHTMQCPCWHSQTLTQERSWSSGCNWPQALCSLSSASVPLISASFFVLPSPVPLRSDRSGVPALALGLGRLGLH